MYKSTSQRFREILKIFASYGFGYVVDNKLKKENNSPENLRKAFEELGPTFIKIGQILSTRPDIVPAPYIKELSKLHDNAYSENFSDICKIFFNEFFIKLDSAFSYFEEEPFASASISQVHNATLKDGRKVIVKIQRPDIAEKMRMDIAILKRIVNIAKLKISETFIDPEEALNELLIATELELNFYNEAENIERFREMNKDVKFLCTPYVIKDLSSSKVLTMEKIDGFKIDDTVSLLNNGYDLNDIGKKLALFFLKQILKDGFFHGDPHPGNIIVKDNKICFIDFGLMGGFSHSLKESLNDILIALAYKDINKLAAVVISISIKKGPINRNRLHEDIEYLYDKYLFTSLESIKLSDVLQDLLDMSKQNNLILPKELTLLARSLLILEGVVAKISPDIKIIDVAIPYVKENIKSSMLKDIDFDKLLINSLNNARAAAKLPSKFMELSDGLLNGRVKLQFELKYLNKSINELNKMTNRLVFGVVVSSMIIGSSFILNSNIGPKLWDISIIGILGFIAAGFTGLWLLISIIKSGRM
ncbi:ABC1 family protein [Clostridiales bacterium oral taxon 876 str. F0540]|nr:ABC1 family protein [Clostridiales bacterium oral taxon 876 str. F0540]